MFFLHFMLFPTFLETNNFGNKFLFLFRKTLLFHLMFFSCFVMLDLFPTFLDFFLKY